MKKKQGVYSLADRKLKKETEQMLHEFNEIWEDVAAYNYAKLIMLNSLLKNLANSNVTKKENILNSLSEEELETLEKVRILSKAVSPQQKSEELVKYIVKFLENR